MPTPRIYALVRQPDGTIVKKPVDFRGVEKLEKRMTDDFRKKLWINKNTYKYLDDKNREESI